MEFTKNCTKCGTTEGARYADPDHPDFRETNRDLPHTICWNCLMVGSEDRFVKAITDSRAVYTRVNRWGGIAVYFRDTTSPSGVIRGGGLEKGKWEPIVDGLINSGKISSRLSPLSPTEGRVYGIK